MKMKVEMEVEVEKGSSASNGSSSSNRSGKEALDALRNSFQPPDPTLKGDGGDGDDDNDGDGDGDGRSKNKSKSNNRIALLDVGSCFNPHSRGEHASLLSVTALDLFPQHASVLQCDFLKVKIEGAHLVLASNTGTDSCSRVVTTIPAGFYHAATLSLVLCYLPSARERSEMVRQCRLALMPAPSANSVGGLLLIAEKGSVFPTQQAMCSRYVNAWKEEMARIGFAMVKYEAKDIYGYVYGSTSSFLPSFLPSFLSYHYCITRHDKSLTTLPFFFRPITDLNNVTYITSHSTYFLPHRYGASAGLGASAGNGKANKHRVHLFAFRRTDTHDGGGGGGGGGGGSGCGLVIKSDFTAKFGPGSADAVLPRPAAKLEKRGRSDPNPNREKRPREGENGS
jgi:hypothetical protein